MPVEMVREPQQEEKECRTWDFWPLAFVSNESIEAFRCPGNEVSKSSGFRDLDLDS